VNQLRTLVTILASFVVAGCPSSVDSSASVTEGHQSAAVSAKSGSESQSPLVRVARGERVQLPPAQGPLPAVRADLHVDTVTAMMDRNIAWNDASLEASLPALEEAGVNVVVQAAWIPRGAKDPRGAALGKLHRIRNMVLRSGGKAAIVTGPEQLEQVLRDRRIAVILALEGGTALTAGVATLDEFRALGLSMVGLTWTESSQYADSSAEPLAAGGGLTAAGRELVAACNDRGVLLDVSHMSDRATADTIEASRAPVLASHSNAQSLCPVPRNLNDTLLSSIARKGGLVGAMFHGPFVVGGRPATRADVVAQVLGLVERIGADHVGIGSDWDGRIKSPEGLRGSRDLAALYQELRASGLSEREVRKLAGDNLLRLWRRAWGVRAPTKSRPEPG
jgi:membrane dipeptidase